MWYSIKEIIRPASWKDAWELKKDPKKAYLSGGSYLVAGQNSEIDALIDLNGLLDHTVSVGQEEVCIGAGVTLQTFIDTARKIQQDNLLIDASRESCPSKNIRNQRTLGGEIGQNRANSEVLVFLHSVNAKLTIMTNREESVSIRDWDGQGIVTEIRYFPDQMEGIYLRRYALIPSAPAIVIVGANKTNGQLEFSIGGAAKRIQNFFAPSDKWNDQIAATLAVTAVKQFSGDHLGSVEYKCSLITTALKRAGGAL